MAKTIVGLYAAPYVQNFCLYALHVQAKLGVDEAIKPGTGPPRGRLQGKIEDFWFPGFQEELPHEQSLPEDTLLSKFILKEKSVLSDFRG